MTTFDLDAGKMLSEAARALQSTGSAASAPDAADKPILCGVDIGTSSVVLLVVDAESGMPLAGAYERAAVVRDGLVVDYQEAVNIAGRLKQKTEDILNRNIQYAATGFPPRVSRRDAESKAHAVEAAGFTVTNLVDEPTAANSVLQIRDGAIVDVGAGTTGIAVFQDGRKVYEADEPTGGTHMSLVIAGARGIEYEEAERLKLEPELQGELFPLISPVMEKIASIVKYHVSSYAVSRLYLVGGGSAFPGTDGVIQRNTGIPTSLSPHPLWVTPLGIALNCIIEGTGRIGTWIEH